MLLKLISSIAFQVFDKKKIEQLKTLPTMCQIKSVQLIPVGYRVIRIILLKFSCPIDKRGDDGKEKRTAPKKIILNWSLIIEFE